MLQLAAPATAASRPLPDGIGGVPVAADGAGFDALLPTSSEPAAPAGQPVAASGNVLPIVPPADPLAWLAAPEDGTTVFVPTVKPPTTEPAPHMIAAGSLFASAARLPLPTTGLRVAELAVAFDRSDAPSAAASSVMPAPAAPTVALAVAPSKTTVGDAATPADPQPPVIPVRGTTAGIVPPLPPRAQHAVTREPTPAAADTSPADRSHDPAIGAPARDAMDALPEDRQRDAAVCERAPDRTDAVDVSPEPEHPLRDDAGAPRIAATLPALVATPSAQPVLFTVPGSDADVGADLTIAPPRAKSRSGRSLPAATPSVASFAAASAGHGVPTESTSASRFSVATPIAPAAASLPPPASASVPRTIVPPATSPTVPVTAILLPGTGDEALAGSAKQPVSAAVRMSAAPAAGTTAAASLDPAPPASARPLRFVDPVPAAESAPMLAAAPTLPAAQPAAAAAVPIAVSGRAQDVGAGPQRSGRLPDGARSHTIDTIAVPVEPVAPITPAAPALPPHWRIADMARADRSSLDALAALAGTGTAAPAAPHAPSAPVLDLSHARWPETMMARIERLRDDADAADTRIRVVPDALGLIEVSLRREQDTVHVRFAADHAATRTLLAEAQPRLAELAEARGWRLGDAGVGGQDQPRYAPRPAPLPPRPAAPASARADDDTAATDQRLA